MTIATVVNSPAKGLRKKYPTIEELKKKYESYTTAAAQIPLATARQNALKVLKKSKVKQIASMFDSKISESVKDPAINSPEAKQQINPSMPAIRHSVKSNLAKEKVPITSPRTTSKFKAQQNSNTCFASADGFSKLSVKHKVQLYNRFINEISKRNPKFVKHAELMEACVEKAEVRGEVVNEKQASVKHLLAKLEASRTFPRQKVSPLALQRLCTDKNDSDNVKAELPTNFKIENILENTKRHVSTLTVKLHPFKTVIYRRRLKSFPHCKPENKHVFNVTLINATSHKRNNKQMCYSVPFEVFAPPKKIRRTRAERLTPKIFFRSHQLKNLFFTWLSEREHAQNVKKGKPAEGIINSSTDQFAEDTVEKLETSDTSTSKDNEKQSTNCKTPDSKSRQRTKKPATEIPAQASKATNSQATTTLSDKPQANDESESGLSLLQKITSDESQADNLEVKTDKNLHFVKTSKPARRKKLLRRTLTWQNSESSTATTPITNSTDSDTENKPGETKIKELSFKSTTNPSSEELDGDILREANSPRRIKSAYTLTVYSPSPTQEEQDKIKYSSREFPQSIGTATENLSSSSQENRHKKQGTAQTWPTLVKNCTEQQIQSSNKVSSASVTGKNKASVADVNGKAPNTFDSFIDQGFETGSNDMDSPVRISKCCACNKQDNGQFNSTILESTTGARKETLKSSCCSTSISESQPNRFTNSLSPQQLQHCSPTAMPLKSRRKSMYDKESRPSSLPMQVIRENQPLKHHECSPRSIGTKDQKLHSTSPTLEMPNNLAGLRPEQGSQFWIKCGNYALIFDIFYSKAERLRLLYNIFSEKRCDNMALYFGIDNLTFTGSQADDKPNVLKRLRLMKQYSQYWFATGDVIIPFTGKRLSPDKIQHVFAFLKTSVQDNDVIHFGVDDIEFSNVREFSNQTPTFSMESNYSMLVGLQSGSSNGLEGRSKYSWPNNKPAGAASNLNQLNGDVDNFEETNSARSSVSPFSDKQFEFTASSPTEPQSGQSMRSSEAFRFFGCKNGSLDHLLDAEYKEFPQQVADPASVALNKCKAQRKSLSLIKEEPATYNNLANVSCDALNALKGTCPYFQHFESMARKIVHKSRRDGFSGCTTQELERYLSFLICYADICLHDSKRYGTARLDRKAVTV